MKNLIIIILVTVTVSAHAQGMRFNADSSILIFPSKVQVRFQKSGVGRMSTFKVSGKDVKVLTTELDFLLGRLRIADENIVAYHKNDSIHRAIVDNMEAKLRAQEERAKNFQQASVEVQKIANKYDQELNQCKSDIALLGKQERKTKRKAFVRGMLVGAGVGVVVAVIGVAALN